MKTRRFEKVSTLIQDDIILPKRATSASAGYDLYCFEDTIINPGEIALIPTGVKALMPSNEGLLLFSRSSTGVKKRLMIPSSVGVIDSDYYNNPENEGHIYCVLYNFGQEIQSIKKNERVCQAIFVNLLLTDDDEPSLYQRRGGFGSSGN